MKILKKLSVSAFFLLAIALNANIIKNSDFDGKLFPEYRRSGNLQNNNFSIFTEDLTWNKCGKLELIRYDEDKDGLKSYSAGIIIGGDENLAGFSVTPGETYKFSMELKGTVKGAFVALMYWTGECRYYDDRKKGETSVEKVKIQKDWTKYKGTFKIPKDAKRAALYASVWGSEKHKHMPDMPGEYLLVDNIEIEKSVTNLRLLNHGSESESTAMETKKALILKLNSEEPVIDGKLDDLQWENTPEISGFCFYKDESPAKNQTTAKILAGKESLYIGIKCDEPAIDKLKSSYSGNGGKEIWSNDEIEIFFDSRSKDRVLNQFVVGAGGGRWMGWGEQAVQPGAASYDKWEAKTEKGKGFWTAEIKIPYTTLAWEKAPENGTTTAFNISRQRLAQEKELSCWSPVRGNFHEKDRYGVLAFGTLNKDILKQIENIRSKLLEIKKESPEKAGIVASLNKLTESLKKELTTEEWQDARGNLITAEREIFFLKFKDMNYAVTSVTPCDTDFSLPLVPENIQVNDKKIECKSAINEFKSSAILVTNLTNETQDYRVLLCAEENNGIEVFGLKGINGAFPDGKIEMRQAVRVKDGDGKSHQQRFDPLVLMNQAFTITVPPKDSGLVWLTFDCRDVKPDLYKGFIRVIPLNEAAKFELTKKGWEYFGTMRDIPFELELWPIELSRKPAIPLWLMKAAANEKFFRDMIEHDNRIFQLSPYLFKTDFDENGFAVGKFDETISGIVKNHLEWAKKYKVDIQFLLGFSAYNIFQNHVLKNKFKYGTEEWKNAWKSWIKEIDKFFKEHGVGAKDYYVEVWDEPHVPDAEKVIETCRLAKEASPETQFQITFGASKHSSENMKKMLPFVDVWCLWGAYYDDPDFKPFLEILKSEKKEVWMYFCNTNIRASLYRYYRVHAWRGLCNKNPKLGLFTYLNGPGGHYGRASWKTCAEGALIYNSLNEPVTSIRYECLREGFEDLKYMKKLEEMLSLGKTKGVDSGLTAEVEKFLDKTPFDVVVKQPHNTKAASDARARAAELIIKLQKAITGN
ncbi:MAG: hypothetical protein A2020_02190 [Lentisphaerae bacterium GWF2_45_14]|nr:MAG: hypothetical protein A2020_02190 [Lentisphaerae bacterium GWF2_45_14]